MFARHTGVLGVKSGYSGGREQNPTYEAVKHQQTGHRETIRVEYDPEAVSFGELLDLFLQNTDPFDADGQFIDRGHSDTLAGYWQTAAEKEITEEKLKRLEETSGKKTGVAIEPFDTFWLAEESHQDYYQRLLYLQLYSLTELQHLVLMFYPHRNNFFYFYLLI